MKSYRLLKILQDKRVTFKKFKELLDKNNYNISLHQYNSFKPQKEFTRIKFQYRNLKIISLLQLINKVDFIYPGVLLICNYGIKSDFSYLKNNILHFVFLRCKLRKRYKTNLTNLGLLKKIKLVFIQEKFISDKIIINDNIIELEIDYLEKLKKSILIRYDSKLFNFLISGVSSKDILYSILRHNNTIDNNYKYFNESDYRKLLRDKILILHKNKCCFCNSDNILSLYYKTYKSLGDELDSDLTVLCYKCRIKVSSFLSVKNIDKLIAEVSNYQFKKKEPKYPVLYFLKIKNRLDKLLSEKI